MHPRVAFSPPHPSQKSLIDSLELLHYVFGREELIFTIIYTTLEWCLQTPTVSKASLSQAVYKQHSKS